jgi:transcriptional regulator with XRE-family HTH domain
MFVRIRDLREDSDLTQKQVAGLLHCSQQVYSNYELGQRDIPTDVLIRLAGFYGTSVDYLLGLTDRRAPYGKSSSVRQP